MKQISKLIIRDIIVLSAQAVAYRLGVPHETQNGTFLSVMPMSAGSSMTKALSDENIQQRRMGF